jgi:hypothetical protein
LNNYPGHNFNESKILTNAEKITRPQTNLQSSHVSHSHQANQPGGSYTGGKIVVPD